MLRPLVNQEPIILFMATIGLAFFLDGFGQLVWGGDVHPLDIGIPKAPLIIGGVLVNEFDLVAAAVAGSLVLGLVLFQRTAIGRALRAVADYRNSLTPEVEVVFPPGRVDDGSVKGIETEDVRILGLVERAHRADQDS